MNHSSQLQQKSISDQLTPFVYAFLRYWRIAMGPALLVVMIGGLVAIKLPDYYTADAVIFIQPQRLASKIVENQSEKELQSQLEGLVQEILSRPRLRAIIDQYKLYPDISGEGAAQKAIIKLKNEITIEPLKSDTGTGTLQTFQLKYNHRDPQTAFQVAKTISNLFVEESLLAKKSEAQGTEEFLDTKLREARDKLEETEGKVQAFVKANSGRLPEHREAAIARLQNMQQQLATNSQLLAANQMRRSNLDQELGFARKNAELGAASIATNDSATDPHEKLAQLQSALVVLRSQYSDKHPDVIRTKARIEALQSRIREGGGSHGGAVIDTPQTASVRRELGEVDVQIKSLESENVRLKTDITQLDKIIQEMPLRDQELAKIRRDYENTKATYDKLLVGREEAGLQGDLIRSQRDARFKIVQPAELPEFPSGPNRLLIVGVSIVFGLVIFVSIPFVAFFLNGSFKFREEIEDELNVHVIGVVPSIGTTQALALRTRTLMFSVVLSLLAFGLISCGVFVFMK